MTTALYARTAVAEPYAANSVTDQVAQLRACAATNGWHVSAALTFADDGVSGATLDRPGLNALRAAVAAGQVKCLLTQDADRLARSLADQIRLAREFAAAGCTVILAGSLVPA